GRDVDDVGRNEAASFLQAFNLGRVSGEDLFARRVFAADAPFDIPLLVPDAMRLEVGANFFYVRNVPVFVLNANACHVGCSLSVYQHDAQASAWSGCVSAALACASC